MNRHRRDPAPEERIVPGLERIRAALALDGHPERAFRAIHVAGTNGKGSASAFAASILRRLEPGGVGLYTSPHLLSPVERIRIDCVPIPGNELDSRLVRAGSVSEEVERRKGAGLSWFERMTWAAFDWFRDRGVPLAVLETGLGGRWDATSTCRPSVCAITTIAIDHADWLGGTIRGIAAEKAGIFRAGVPVVLGRVGRVPRSVLLGRARELDAPVWELGPDFGWEAAGDGAVRFRLPDVTVGPVVLPLRGTYQNDNAAVACAAAWRDAAGSGTGSAEFAEAAGRGIAEARWPGRLSPLPGRGNRGAWADGAHNPASAKALADEILRGNAFGGRRPVVALWSMLGDKDVGGFVRAMAPAVDAWVAYPLAHERAAPVGTLLRAAGRSGARAVGSAPDFLTAWRDARAIAGSGGAVIVCGSLVAVADAYSERVGHI